MMQKFILGVNYWPRKKGIFWWKYFDAQEVKREFDQIKSIGLDTVRIFLLWEDFQPKADKVNQEAIANLISVFRIAQKRTLKILLTLFVGHMSGENWAPTWLTKKTTNRKNPFSVIVSGKRTRFGIRNIYQDKKILAASSLLIKTIVYSVKNEKALLGYDLANEIDNFLKPTNRKQANKWVNFIVKKIREIDKVHPITLGLHLKNIEAERGFWPQDLAKVCDFLSMHSYSLYAKWADNYLDGKVAGFTNTLIAKMSSAKVMHTEFGLCTTPNKSRQIKTIINGKVSKCYLVNENEARHYFAASLKGLYENGALGVMFWCYSDYDPILFNQPPFDRAIHERSFGLFRSNGQLKPYKDIIKEYQNLKVRQIPNPQKIDNQIYYNKPMEYLSKENFLYNSSNL